LWGGEKPQTKTIAKEKGKVGGGIDLKSNERAQGRTAIKRTEEENKIQGPGGRVFDLQGTGKRREKKKKEK